VRGVVSVADVVAAQRGLPTRHGQIFTDGRGQGEPPPLLTLPLLPTPSKNPYPNLHLESEQPRSSDASSRPPALCSQVTFNKNPKKKYQNHQKPNAPLPLRKTLSENALALYSLKCRRKAKESKTLTPPTEAAVQYCHFSHHSSTTPPKFRPSLPFERNTLRKSPGLISHSL